jgi:hypothetical protein
LSAETCNGIDDDGDGNTDDLGSFSCGMGACRVTVPACQDGQIVACLPLAPASTVDDCGGEDDDCDGAVDEDCALCLHVAKTGDDAAAAASDGAQPFATVQAAVDFADTHREFATRVCVAAGSACGSSASYDGPAGADFTMRDGISVLANYESTSWTRCGAGTTTRLVPQTSNGIVFPSSITQQTILDGFVIDRLKLATITGVTVDGAKGVVLSNLTIPTQSGGAPVQTVAYGVNVINGADALIFRSRIHSGTSGSGFSIGVRAVGARVDIEDCCPTSVDPVTGRCSASCTALGAGPAILDSYSFQSQQAAVYLEDAASSRVERSAICTTPNEANGQSAVQVTGSSDGVLLRANTISGSQRASQLAATLRVEACEGTSPWIVDNASILAQSSSGGGYLTALRSSGACNTRIESNASIRVRTNRNAYQGRSIECEALGGDASPCVVTKNRQIGVDVDLGTGTSSGSRQWFGIRCTGGSCSRIDQNQVTGATASGGPCTSGNCSETPVGLEIDDGEQLVDRNTIDSGCGILCRATGARISGGARVQNNFIVARGTGGSIALAVEAGDSGPELIVHSNTLQPNSLTPSSLYPSDELHCTGIEFTGTSGVVRNNLITMSSCPDAVAFRESVVSYPRLFENNNLGVLPFSAFTPAALYLDNGLTRLQTAANVNALTDTTASGTLSVACTHPLASGSPCIDAGTPAGAPALDLDGDTRDETPDIGADESP